MAARSPESIFARWLARRETAEATDFASLLRAHAEHAVRLRELRAIQVELERAMREAGLAGSLDDRSKSLHGSEVDARVELAGEEPADLASTLLGRRSGRTPSSARYHVEGEVGRGGMGAVLRVWDDDLERHLAMKVLLGKDEPGPGADTPSADRRQLARFLEEARITGQLEHPGIVPVHELGLDAAGRVFFTMKLVQGKTLADVFDELREGTGGWTPTRVLGLILKACEAMSYAHAKGVIHRDLKPANVMVGQFGEVYVMDWGLAKILGRADGKDLRIRDPEATSEVRSDRRADEPLGSPLCTMDGHVVGTPAYMSPEQAQNRVEAIGPPSDVYALGAVLYHLLAGQMPYVPPGARLDNHAVWRLVQARPPQPLSELAPADVPAELVAICDKAMAREIEARYADMRALAADLAAFLEHRVVAAYETGAWAEARKWVERNKPLAASLAAAVLLLAGGLATSLVFKTRSDENARLAARRAEETAEQARIAQANEQRAREQEELATRRAEDVLSLSVSKDLEDLVARAETLWPPHPRLVDDYERWLADAQALIEGRAADPARGLKRRPSLEEHRAKLADLRARALAPAATAAATEREPLARGARPETLEHAAQSPAHAFEDPEAAWWQAQLSKLVADLEALRDPRTGIMGDTLAEPFGWGVARRHRFAREIGERSVDDAHARELWAEASAAIAASPTYGGLELKPQVGLLPIGPDPASGLWEFAHLLTGEPAARGADGELALSEEAGVVLVLLPGGSFWMGAQKQDRDGRNHDPQARADEGPVHEVELSAFFLSKHEMTQGQWTRLRGSNPSFYQASRHAPTLLHPVEQVSWLDCMTWLPRAGLALPSEAQWEYGARGGTGTPWWTGAERESLREKRAANLADQTAAREGATWPEIQDWPELDDGYAVHAPVATYAANAFGLHDVTGNLGEWCLDGYDETFYRRSPRLDPVARWQDAVNRVARGGGFRLTASPARSAYRLTSMPVLADITVGVRAARAIDP